MLLRLRNSFASMTQAIRQQERTANNLANVNTTGYKKERFFAETLNEFINAEGSPESTRNLRQWTDFSPGTLEPTGNTFDLAIDGEGLFTVTDPQGQTRFTRAGHFMLDAEGYLRMPNGFLVQGNNGPVQIPIGAKEVIINDRGEIHVDGELIDQLTIVWFENPEMLERLDGTTFGAGTQTPIEIKTPHVRQGYLETANVNTMQEMTDMIAHFRLFETQQKVLQTQDQLLGRVTRELGKW